MCACQPITRRCNRQPKLSLVLQTPAKQAPFLSAAERGVTFLIRVLENFLNEDWCRRTDETRGNDLRR